MEAKLEGVPETLLITVKARANETLSKDPIVSDPHAVNIIDQLKLPDDAKNSISAASQIGCIIRTLILDRITEDFHQRYPEGIVVQLGCGLDARYERLGKSFAGWWDIDVPEAMAVRRRFFEDKHNYIMVERSMFDYAWMDEIPKDRPVLIMAEGVFMYFAEDQIKELFSKIFTTFTRVEMAFDTIAPFLAKRTNLHMDLRKYNAVFKWGLDRTTDLKKWDEHIEEIESYYYFDYYKERWPFAMKLIGLVPAFKRGNKVAHIRYTR